ncbi:hypothetical protein, partial [Streptococcus anginosus]|uniref:hypothetical protein n=1 Tax=Streptococcus anginosus TaxID=1328 RepID=UPI002ED8E38C
KQYTVYITTGFIYSLKLRRCIFPVNPVDFHVCENDQKTATHTTCYFHPMPQKPAQTLPFSGLSMFY